MAEFQTISLQIDKAGIARLTLNRPEARNAMSQGMIQELAVAVSEIVANDAVRVVVLTGGQGTISVRGAT